MFDLHLITHWCHGNPWPARCHSVSADHPAWSPMVIEVIPYCSPAIFCAWMVTGEAATDDGHVATLKRCSPLPTGWMTPWQVRYSIVKRSCYGLHIAIQNLNYCSNLLLVVLGGFLICPSALFEIILASAQHFLSKGYRIYIWYRELNVMQINVTCRFHFMKIKMF